jgi:hypothetical protein
MEFSNETALLQDIYNGAVMGTQAITYLLPKVNNARFRSDLQTQNKQYQETAGQAEGQLKALGVCPKEPDTWQTKMLWMCIQGKTMYNKDTSHLAELMIQGSNMGILNLTKAVNGYPKAGEGQADQTKKDVRQKALDLAKATIQGEEDNINRLKAYLQ